MIRSKLIEVPQIEIEEEHCKVGDGMLSKSIVDAIEEGKAIWRPDYVIHQLALVVVDESDGIFEARWYDEKGIVRGTRRMILEPK